MPGARVSPNPKLSKEKPEVYIAMGNAGDNVARDFKITREELDEWALMSNGEGTVYFPAPGAVVLFGLAGLTARRRRRRT